MATPSGDHDPLGPVRDLIGRGEYLLAYDEVGRTQAENERTPEGDYLAVLALARAGATARAEEEFERRRLDALDPAEVGTRLAEDAAALRARLAKDRALAGSASRRSARAAEAAALYEGIHDRLGGSYTGINAATMWAVADRRDRAAGLARAALDQCRAELPDEPQDAYWNLATQAEAAILLGELDVAHDALVAASAANPEDYAARASTRRQLLTLCELLGIDRDLLTPLSNPLVVHYCGHRIAPPDQPGRFPAGNEAKVAASIEAFTKGHRIGFAFGSLASGADILVAEAVLATGAELHVVLPFDVPEFVEVSVADSGEAWVQRFHACLDRAASVTLSTEGPYLGDDALFDYCSRVAMGDTLIRAEFLTTDAHQLAVWDGETTADPAGTAVDIATWRQDDRPSTVIPSRSGATIDEPSLAPPDRLAASTAPLPVERPGARVVRAMIFGDIAGFSKLGDAETPPFIDHVLGAIAEVLDRHEDKLMIRHTWGDGIYLVLPGVAEAAEVALDLQERLADLDYGAAGLGALRGMRMGAHVGPVFEAYDPVMRTRNFLGAHVTRTARIEPKTPEGEVFVTHAFAALATLDRRAPVTCQYVGHVPAAKNYGSLPMYVLKPKPDLHG